MRLHKNKLSGSYELGLFSIGPTSISYVDEFATQPLFVYPDGNIEVSEATKDGYGHSLYWNRQEGWTAVEFPVEEEE